MSTEGKSIEMKTMEAEQPGMKYGMPAEKYDKWMADIQKRKDKKPFEERRIGWITKLPNYKVMCCGQSAKDFFLILFLMIVFYVVNALFFWAFWEITSLNVVITSYIYGGLGLAFLLALLVGMVINSKANENTYLENLANEMN